MKSYNIAVVPGDGTGPEVVAEGMKVLDAVSKRFDFKLNYTNFDFGGERYLNTGEVLPDGAVDELRKFDAIFPASSKRASCCGCGSSWTSTSTSGR
jgi:3-isopropylmalate dehydrogenase